MSLTLTHFKQFLSNGYAIILLVDQPKLREIRYKPLDRVRQFRRTLGRVYGWLCGCVKFNEDREVGEEKVIHIQHSQIVHLYNDGKSDAKPIDRKEKDEYIQSSVTSSMNIPVDRQPDLSFWGYPLIQTLVETERGGFDRRIDTTSVRSDDEDGDYVGHYILLTG